jgi:hypothetical protein
MMFWWLLAWAAPDVSALRPVVASVSAPQRHQAWQMAEGMPTDPLVCDPLWQDIALLCFRTWEGGKRRWVTASDAASWKTDAKAMRALLALQAAAHVQRAEMVPVSGMSASYLRLVDGDGWAAALALRPDLLAERLGGAPVRVAMPAEGVLVAWKVGTPELDQVMAVGVREMYEQMKGAVSPRVVTWDGAKFVPFGQAIPKK